MKNETKCKRWVKRKLGLNAVKTESIKYSRVNGTKPRGSLITFNDGSRFIVFKSAGFRKDKGQIKYSVL